MCIVPETPYSTMQQLSGLLSERHHWLRTNKKDKKLYFLHNSQFTFTLSFNWSTKVYMYEFGG